MQNNLSESWQSKLRWGRVIPFRESLTGERKEWQFLGQQQNCCSKAFINSKVTPCRAWRMETTFRCAKTAQSHHLRRSQETASRGCFQIQTFQLRFRGGRLNCRANHRLHHHEYTNQRGALALVAGKQGKSFKRLLLALCPCYFMVCKVLVRGSPSTPVLRERGLEQDKQLL